MSSSSFSPLHKISNVKRISLTFQIFQHFIRWYCGIHQPFISVLCSGIETSCICVTMSEWEIQINPFFRIIISLFYLKSQRIYVRFHLVSIWKLLSNIQFQYLMFLIRHYSDDVTQHSPNICCLSSLSAKLLLLLSCMILWYFNLCQLLKLTLHCITYHFFQDLVRLLNELFGRFDQLANVSRHQGLRTEFDRYSELTFLANFILRFQLIHRCLSLILKVHKLDFHHAINK